MRFFRALAIGFFVMAGLCAYAAPIRQTFSAKQEKYNLSVCAIFKNEAPFLKEWLEYHQLIGVDHFYLYNNGSLDQYKRILAPYVKNQIVTLIPWPDNLGPMANADTHWALSTQLTAYENAIKWSALNRTKWLLFLDIDEFLVPVASNKITDILDQYDSYPGVTLECDYFDASHRSALPSRKWVIEALERTVPLEQSLRKAITKTILKPDLCTTFTWPPYKCDFANEGQAVRVSKKEMRINAYENRMTALDVGRVKRKLNLGRKQVDNDELKEWVKMGYEVEDQEKAIQRFIPLLTKKLAQ